MAIHLEMIKIKELPKEERPREKALLYGIDSLNNRELLAILLRTGYQGNSALGIADSLLANFSSLSNILNASPAELSQIKGISKTKSLELLAIGALSKRAGKETFKKFSSSKEIYESYKERYRNQDKEEIILLNFNREKTLLSEHIMSFNNQSFSSLSVPKTLAKALKDNASGFVLIHNHPSGLPLPSKEDIIFTNSLKEAASNVHLSFLDHIIIGRDSYYSFQEEGLFDK